jgi:hypothetical protein
MLKVNEFQLYELANHIHPLTFASHTMKYSDVWFGWFQAREALQNLFKQRALEVCFGVANELYLAIDGVVPRDFDQAINKLPQDADAEQPIGWIANNVKTAAEKFETVISAELSNSDTYWISPKGTHKTSMLLQYAHQQIPGAALAEIPEVKADFDEAGRCLLFDISTATGFHLLRATEAVIRKYYSTITGTMPPVKFRNWGAYIRVLKTKPQVNQKIITMLDHIRDHYRNPILHPDESLTPDEALVLFGLCASAITLMGNEMKALVQQTKPLPFLAAEAN